MWQERTEKRQGRKKDWEERALRGDNSPMQSGDLEPITLSASQISSYRECQRKWAFHYIEKVESKSTPAQELGTETENEQLQPYLLTGRAFEHTTKDGKPKPSGEIAASSLAYLPKPVVAGLEMQRHFIMPSPTWIGAKPEPGAGAAEAVHCGVLYQGYLDLWHADSSVFPGYEGGAPHVGDFKTTSDLKWAKNEKALLVDPQAMLYATHALFSTRLQGKAAHAVDLGWIYMQTRGPRKAKRTKLRVFPEHVMEQFQDLDATGQEIARTRRAGNRGEIKALDLPPSPDACESFGGCPYRDKCNLSPSQIIASMAAKADQLLKLKGPSGLETKGNHMTMDAGMTLLQQLQAKKAAADQGAATLQGAQSPAASTFPTPAVSAVAPPLPSLLSMMQAAPPPPPVPIAPAPPPAPIVPAAPPPPDTSAIGVLQTGAFVYAHEADQYDFIGNAADGRPVYRPKGAVPRSLPPSVPTQAAESNQWPQPINPPESALAPAQAVGTEAPKRKPGRPKKDGAAGASAGASAGAAVTVGVDVVPNLDDAVAFVKALQAGCAAFLAAIEGAE